MAGRKTLFTPEVRKAIIDALRNGMSNKDAAAQAGVSESLFYEWQAIGNAWKNGIVHKEAPKTVIERNLFVEFVEEVKKAQSVKRIAALGTIQKTIREHWIHRKTGQIIYAPPPSMTWLNRITGQVLFARPDDAFDDALWEQEWAGHAWEHNAGNWTAAAWLLERTDPDSYAQRTFTSKDQLARLARIAADKGYDVEELLDTLIAEIENDASTPDDSDTE